MVESTNAMVTIRRTSFAARKLTLMMPELLIGVRIPVSGDSKSKSEFVQLSKSDIDA